VKGDGIVASESDQLAAIVALLDEILDDDSELITVITGDDADDDVTEAIEGWLADHHGAVSVEVHSGGQPLYPYLFGVE
jgi:dihydroxyacetone kinase-like predicted kinase